MVKRCLWFSLAVALAVCCLLLASTLLPSPLPEQFPVACSSRVVDRHGETLRLFTTVDGFWRLPVRIEQADRLGAAAVGDVDPQFIRLLLSYEDKRFWSHAGVDPLALGRAVSQFIRNGRVVSGASTITMQTVRLLKPHPRTVGWKLYEMIQAVRLEQLLSKEEILACYLTLAPYGGNIEGITAACRLYFHTTPARLTPSQAALLISLPQSPEQRRPDRHPDRARAARDTVLERLAAAGVLSMEQVQLGRQQSVPEKRFPVPFLAPQLSQWLHAARPEQERLETTLDRGLQQQMERIAGQLQQRLAAGKTLAILVVDNQSHQVVAHVGSGDFQISQLDLTRAVRSPGSTLKPFIYGLAFEQGFLHPETMIQDQPQRFGSYGPRNFSGQYLGWISVREALHRSLNLPAVQVLERLGPQRLLSRFSRLGLALEGENSGLTLALGGTGTTLRQLVALYAALAEQGSYRPVSFTPRQAAETAETAEEKSRNRVLLSAAAAWYVDDILRSMPLPAGLTADSNQSAEIRFKTGTSYGFRDAWALGYTPGYTVGVWVGRPDGGYGRETTGAGSAVPVMLQVFSALGMREQAAGQGKRGADTVQPANVLQVRNSELPPGLQRFYSGKGLNSRFDAPRILFPVDGSRLQLNNSDRGRAWLALKSRGGTPPFYWLINGKPLGQEQQRAVSQYRPEGTGLTRITLIDSRGRRDKVTVWVGGDVME